MKFDLFCERVREILSEELPEGRDVVAAGRGIARDIELGLSSFCRAKGVASELEYKRRCMREGRIMYHCHIGMSSWKDTAAALRELYRYTTSAGYVQDRAGICLDRRMALPGGMRSSAPAETGPMLEDVSDWMAVASTVPIQPHMGDFMIGFPSSTENTAYALQAGVTTVGNLSQFFSHEAPLWKDKAYTAVETVKAIALMGAFRERGTLVHSYLDDGFGALFFDCATIAGWALLEKYIVEDLLGAKLAHCMGGLISDPIKRSGWVFALDEIHDGDCVGSMFFGDTISFTKNFDLNRALVAEYLMWDIMTQLACPTGHAVLPMPVTEAVRVPTLEEIIEAQTFARRIEPAARRMLPHFDFSAPKAFARKVVDEGRSVFRKALEGLSECGVDVRDPVRLLYVLKRLGPAAFEQMFGAGPAEPTQPRGRTSIVPNDVFERSRELVEANRQHFADERLLEALSGKRVLLASTDVHEHALYVIGNLLRETPATVIDTGAERNADEVAADALSAGADMVFVSTHNGMALEYAHMLLEEMEERGLGTPIVMGGVLNQKVDEDAVPVDVTVELQKMGILTAADMKALSGLICERKAPARCRL